MSLSWICQCISEWKQHPECEMSKTNINGPQLVVTYHLGLYFPSAIIIFLKWSPWWPLDKRWQQFLAAKWRFGIFCLLKSLHYHPIITTPFFHPFPSYPSLNFSHLLKLQTPERENWINQPLMPVASITTWKPGSDFAWLLDCWDICRITVIYMQVVCYNLNITFGLKNWDSVGFWSKLFFGFGSDFVSRSQHSQ